MLQDAQNSILENHQYSLGIYLKKTMIDYKHTTYNDLTKY